MNLSIIKKTSLAFFAFAFLSSCTEQYVYQNQDFEDAMSVEATLTNELKYQEINISRTRLVNDTIKKPESGAKVTVVDSDGNVFNFDEKDGKYISVNEFKVEPNKNYQLKITTKSGKSYISSQQVLTTQNSIDLEAKMAEKDGTQGVQINVKSFDPANTSKYYRYEYEETYKVQTVYNTTERVELVPYQGSFKMIIVPAEPNTHICYSTKHSTGIIQTNTKDLTEDRVNFPVRFIDKSNYIIAYRYSILVSQYTQSQAAYDYYYTSKKMVDSGELLSPNQPGYIIGNIKSTSDSSEKVVGFFEVASVAKKRIFFNFTDIFPSDDPTTFFRKCEPEEIQFSDIPVDNYKVLSTHVYIGGGPGLSPTSYWMVEKQCGDCTTFSSNVIPSFWEN
ncbi:DUF4249 domain-containing protein [Flavobacterium sharifuzzamanii]|uniref:DUF4249 domain-containing protein n=1 Tax=Flavobacterium sharifuzzamanii TaxID=2211133 RepID=UPI001300825B|nr:DUF4249 domain-containing protein [Flavobacterium sharifuzzamanii]KAF2079529.1 DUF4249 domain-containing protein [Flavobacterium sharifuzzamanii]